MNAVYDLDKRRLPPLLNRYPLVLPEDIPSEYKSVQVMYKRDEIKSFEVIIIHRLMIKNYGRPSLLECNLSPNDAKKYGDQKIIMVRQEGKNTWGVVFSKNVNSEMAEEISNGKIVPQPLEWVYFVSVESDEIIKIATEDHHNSISISLIYNDHQNKPTKNGTKEANNFVSDLLKEANRLQGQLFNLKKEFIKGEGLRHYFLNNVYLSNYISAEIMLEFAVKNEPVLQDEALRFDARTEDIKDPEKVAHMDRFLHAKGMFYGASISYYFMSFEGFVNLIYHAFLKPGYPESDLDLERRLDLEMKLQLMPSLCNGFKNNRIDSKSELYKNFKKLKSYRNLIFHSKTEDALKWASIFEGHFLYSCNMDKIRDRLLPSYRFELQQKDVLVVKKIIDSMIKEVVSRMEPQFKALTTEYIMNELQIPFFKIETGEIRMGKSIYTLKETGGGPQYAG